MRKHDGTVMFMKLAVLKPIMWNNNGYRRPAGCPSTSGYSHDHGYGHEEWNGNPKWLWRGFRVFHTEGTGRLVQAGKSGELGMVMITSHDATAFAVGVATSVIVNSDDERRLIAEAVGVANEASHVWSLTTVRDAFVSDESAFMKHWNRQYPWIQWRCPPDEYHWFEKPIPLDPQRITGKTKLAMHHGTYTQLDPAVLLDIVDRHLPASKAAIGDWLCFGDFDLSVSQDRPASAAHVAGNRKRNRLRRTRNAPTDHRFQYWVEGNRTVEPLHHQLQSRFVEYLQAVGICVKEDDHYIDVQYKQDGLTLFAEIKPTDNVETRYAIRVAIGQLMEYRFRHDPEARLEIVLGKKPKADEVDFIKSLGLRLTYYDHRSATFKSL